VTGIEGLAEDFQIIVDKPGELDRLKVKIEHKPEVKGLRALKNQVEEALGRHLGVKNEVELAPLGTISRTTFKAQRVVKTY